MGFGRLIVLRTAQLLVFVFGFLVLSFAILHAFPGDPIYFLVGEGGADPAYIAEVRKKFGLDRPWQEQFWTYSGQLVMGNLGDSIIYQQPVAQLMLQRLLPTLLLTGISLAITVVVGVGVGVWLAGRSDALISRIIVWGTTAVQSIPVFWLGQILVLLFSLHLGLLPVSGMRSFSGIGSGSLQDILRHLLLPALTLSAAETILIVRLSMTSVLGVLQSDYIRTARAKGLSEYRVLRVHALKNALLPTITVLGLRLGYVMSGAVLVENVFGWPGLGRLLTQSVLGRDYPVVMGILLVTALTVGLAAFLVDVAYGWLDPSIRYV